MSCVLTIKGRIACCIYELSSFGLDQKRGILSSQGQTISQLRLVLSLNFGGTKLYFTGFFLYTDLFMRIGLIVGNGISLSFREYAGNSLSDWNTNFPLSWNIPTPNQPEKLLLENLPKFRDALEQIPKLPYVNDFPLFRLLYEAAKKRAPNNNNGIILDDAMIEARHYLVNAFSRFQVIANQVDPSNWSWIKWLSHHRNCIVGATSFNYDLILETAMRKIELPYHRFLVNEKLEGVTVLKPHGSIDFAFPNIRAADDDKTLAPNCYPLPIYCENCDFPATLMPIEDILKPRLVSNIVLPIEASQYTRLAWIRNGFDWWKNNAPSMTHVVVAGLSYQPCDRSEIDWLLSQVPRTASGVLVNEKPNEELLSFMRNRFVNVDIHGREPQNLF